MVWDTLPALPSFERARRREVYRRLARVVRGHDPTDLPSLEDVRSRLRVFEQHYAGIKAIRVARIVGTMNRTTDFDADFLPKRFDMRARWRDIERAFPESDFPPIVVYQVGDSYFVVDGHHRVGIAKLRNVEFIDAEVTELKARFALPTDVDIANIVHAEQQQMFMEESGLEVAYPEARVECSLPHGYGEMLELVKVHGYHLMQERKQVLGSADIARHWYENVYVPAIETLRSEGLHQIFAGATNADLFLWLHQRRRTLFPEHGGLSLAQAVRLGAVEQRAKTTRKRIRKP